MSTRSKSKGSAFERQIAKSLSFWLTGQDKEYYFYRSPGSGAIATITHFNNDLSGDIIALKPESAEICNILSFECKNGYDKASCFKCIKGNKNDELKSFWIQATNDAKEKYPILIFRKKGMPNILIGISNKLYTQLKSKLTDLRYIKLNWQDDLEEMILLDYNLFLKKITPQMILELK